MRLCPLAHGVPSSFAAESPQGVTNEQFTRMGECAAVGEERKCSRRFFQRRPANIQGVVDNVSLRERLARKGRALRVSVTSADRRRDSFWRRCPMSSAAPWRRWADAIPCSKA